MKFVYTCSVCGKVCKTVNESIFNRQLCADHTPSEEMVKFISEHPKFQEAVEHFKKVATESKHIVCKGCGRSGMLMFAPEQAEQVEDIELCPECLAKEGKMVAIKCKIKKPTSET